MFTLPPGMHRAILPTETSGTKIMAELNPAQHANNCANYLYADGHVETVAESTFYNWVQQDVTRGTNFARPAQ